MTTIALLLTMFLATVVPAEQTPTTGYAPVNGLNMEHPASSS